MSIRTIVLICIVALTLISTAKDIPGKRSGAAKTMGEPRATLSNINRISAYYESNGVHENNPFTGNSGLTFPRGTSSVIYSAGLMFGTLCDDGAMASNQPRVNGNSYNAGFAQGAILGTRTGVTEDPSSPDVRLWRIRRDYATADLTMDAAEMNRTSLALVTEQMVAAVRDQYRKDWQEWPASKGAPFYDANNDGVYTPQFEIVGGVEVPKKYPAADEPGLLNAGQVIWYVANDIRAGDSPWKSKPVGLEQQVTIWGYNDPGALGNVIFKKYKLIYKGTATTPANGKLFDAYVCHWSDPDLGDAGDDYVGCDTTLSMGFIYNSTAVDREYQKFGTIPPALGYDFLQGPVVPSPGDTAIVGLKMRPGYRNLPMTSFLYFAAGGNYSDPPFTQNGSWQWYSMFQGFPATPQPPPYPKKFIDPKTNDSTVFWLSGDPLKDANPSSNPGWIDGLLEKAGDRRILQTSGPFTMNVGDTQEVVIGVVTGIGESYLQSLAAVKENDRYVQALYDSRFEVMPPTVKAEVTYPNTNATMKVSATAAAGAVTLLTATIKGNDLPLFDDGAHGDGAAGDGHFANTIELNRTVAPVGVDIAVVTSTSKKFRISKAVEKVTIAGPLVLENGVIHFDNINGDKQVNNGEYIHFGVTLKNATDFPLKDLRAGFHSNVDFRQDRSYGDLAPGVGKTIPYQQNDGDSFFEFRLPMEYAENTYPASFVVRDVNGNQWLITYPFTVVKQPFIDDTLLSAATNVVGENDSQVGFVLYNPAMSGERYDIWYGGSGTKRNWTVVKNRSDADYASIDIVLRDTNQVPRLTAYPGSKGEGVFTLNDAKISVSYSVTVSNLSGPVMSAAVHAGSSTSNGPIVFPLTFTSGQSSGTWMIPDSLVDDFIAGNLYVNILTEANPFGEIRGQISDGLNPRLTLAVPPYYQDALMSSQNLFLYPEQRLTGFSLFVSLPMNGSKSVKQIAPTVGSVFRTANPEQTYSIRDGAPYPLFGGPKNNERNIDIRFVNGMNWAITSSNLPTTARFIQVPFAVYLDTVRVMPVVMQAGVTDTVWNADSGNGTYNGKPLFDIISGICDNRDNGNTDMSYYAPSNTIFPPTSNSVKGRYINGANHVVKDITIVNESGTGIPPAAGTIIRFEQNKFIRPGDVKSITLRKLGFRSDMISAVPSDYSLEQNYPNPFNPSTRIGFALPQTSHVMLKIYDVVGREVATLVNEFKEAGQYSLEWNGRNQFNRQVSSGVYIYRISSGGFMQSKKMLLLK